MADVTARTKNFYDRQVARLIIEKYGLEELDAIRLFIESDTYQMLIDPMAEVYTFSPKIVFDMWESERITGDPRNSQYIRANYNKVNKKSDFFIYLLERYAEFKKMTAKEVLHQWDELDLTNFIYDMYDIYHTERLENAFHDIDSLIEERKLTL